MMAVVLVRLMHAEAYLATPSCYRVFYRGHLLHLPQRTYRVSQKAIVFHQRDRNYDPGHDSAVVVVIRKACGIVYLSCWRWWSCVSHVSLTRSSVGAASYCRHPTSRPLTGERAQQLFLRFGYHECIHSQSARVPLFATESPPAATILLFYYLARLGGTFSSRS